MKRFFWIPCLVLCVCLLTACDGSGKLDFVRVENPLDGGELILPVENGRGQLAGASASFQTKQTPQELYQAYKALEAEKNLQITPYPSGPLIDQGTGSGARYYWLTVSPEHAKDGRNYLLSNMEADLVDRDIWLEDEWTPAGQQGSNAQTPTTGATILLPYHLIAREELDSSQSSLKQTISAGILYRITGTQEAFYQFYESMNAYRLEKEKNGFSIRSYAEGFDASKALRTCQPVTFTFYEIGGNSYFSAQLD